MACHRSTCTSTSRTPRTSRTARTSRSAAFAAAAMLATVSLLASGSAFGQAYPPVAGAPRAQPQPAPNQTRGYPGQRAGNGQRGRYAQSPPRHGHPNQSPRGRRRTSQRWHGIMSFGIARSVALGDRSFALRKNLGTGTEFDDSTGIDLLFGGSTPGGMFDIGLRIGATFGPLNRKEWQNELGDRLESSALVTVGPTFIWHPLAGSRIDPYVGIDMLYTSMGTSKTVSEEVCDDLGCDNVDFDVPFVSYDGWSFGYLAGVRFFPSERGASWWIHLEAKYLQTTWTTLETSDGTFIVERPEDVSTMNLNQLVVNVGIGIAL